MLDTLYMALVIIGFFALVLHAINQEDKRKGDRRQQDLPHPVERRQGGRRQGGVLGFLAWGFRARWGRFRR